VKVVYERLSRDNLAYAVGLAAEMHRISADGAEWPPFSWEFCKNTMLSSMHNPDRYFTLARTDAGYVGGVVGRVEPFYFGPAILGLEEAWLVREDTPFRAAIGMRLMRGFVDWCMDVKQAFMVQSGDIAGSRAIGVDALYRRMGFTRYGVIYKYARNA
jgi:hypothetical protein